MDFFEPINLHSDGGHILVIPDGNRRYALAKGMSEEETYNFAATITVPEIIRFFLVDRRVAYLTFYALSYYNAKFRKYAELEPILKNQVLAYRSWLYNGVFEGAGIRFRFIGEKELLPDYYIEACDELEVGTRDRKGPQCILLVAYDGAREVQRAINRLMKTAERQHNVGEISLDTILEITCPFDFIIRTGKEQRLSGAPLIPSSYAELFFVEELFPELTENRLSEIWLAFQARQRRFGR